MNSLNVFSVASEAAPFSRTGGLGDVMGALPKALTQHRMNIRVVTPLYATVDRKKHGIRATGQSVTVRCGKRDYDFALHIAPSRKRGLQYLFLSNSLLFDRPRLYINPETGKDYVDNDLRFIAFCKAALKLPTLIDFQPDIMHVHDWQTAIIPLLLSRENTDQPKLNTPGTVLTIHNLAYQGLFPAESLEFTNLPNSMLTPVSGPLEFFGQINLLKGGIVASDQIVTVSKKYAKEITKSPEFGCGLEGLLTERKENLCGILNGVDYKLWSPSRDKALKYKYNRDNLSGKRMNKVELIRKAGLPFRENTPLVGMIARLADQKGFDLIAEAAESLMNMNLQLIVLGSGDSKYHQLLESMESDYPDRMKAYLVFDDSLAHKIEAGADIFLMPSRYEPCGLNQMYSLKYGTVPVVRSVGGLADTITDIQDSSSGNGFLFEEYTADAMLSALSRAIKLYGHKRKWSKLMKTGMAADFSWDHSAAEYAELFRRVSSAKA